jgi:hypothetical protein
LQARKQNLQAGVEGPGPPKTKTRHIFVNPISKTFQNIDKNLGASFFAFCFIAFSGASQRGQRKNTQKAFAKQSVPKKVAKK